MNRKHTFAAGEFYHLYNRGNNKQNIFLDDYDKGRFLKFLYLSNSEKNINFRDDIVKPNINAWDFERGKPLVSIGAWVLMPNHFHIYLTSPKSDLGLAVTKFMRKLSTSYSKYFNAKHNRTGGLFEGNFKSEHVSVENHAKYLFSYIHLNPVKLIDSKWKENGIKDRIKTLSFLEKYKWSSYADFRDRDRIESKILNVSDFPEYFTNKSTFDKEIFEWLTYGEENLALSRT
jgi:putative transposase